ncbi:hypothetical protein ABZT51_36125 [Streptomyces sp. NPDC005373]|uniref:hypothetical protein n=1 Tax=Streptomyces sp. NPDC005373 TaxID=3156879 RepID=UPI0033A212F2
MNYERPLAQVPIVAYRSAPPGVHIAQSQGEFCTLTENALLIPRAAHETVPLSKIGAVHHEHDTTIVIDAVTYTFALECESEAIRDEFAFYIALFADCVLWVNEGRANMKELEKKYLG